MKHFFSNNKGGSLIAVVMVGLLLNITIAVIYMSVNRSIRLTGNRRVNTAALNIAEAGKEHLYGSISNGNFLPVQDSLVEVFTQESFGEGDYTVSCSTNSSSDTVWVSSVGMYQSEPKEISTIASLAPSVVFPTPNVRGAVTARSSINVRGNITVDGRDHDTNGVIIGNGLYGVSTCSLLTIDGNPHVGGGGVAPVRKNQIDAVRTTVAQELAPVSNVFDSPEAFLGLEAGSLDQFKVSNLTTPFRGIYYLTDDFVGPLHFDNSAGILIVHNSSKSAELQINTGNFTGIIITDRMARVAGNAEILGAVVTLTDGEVSTFGVGTAVIKYSSQVLANLNNYLDNMPTVPNEISWKEE